MKSITAYQLSEDKKDFFDKISGDLGADLNEYFKRAEFNPCQKLQHYSCGFIKNQSGELCTTLMGAHHFVFQREDKILPASVINDFVNDKIEEISNGEARRVSRAEKRGIKDEVICLLLPKAFTKRTQVECIIKGDKLFIGSATTKMAEQVCSTIRDALGNLPVIPLEPINLTGIVLNGEEKEIKPLEKVKLIQAKGGATSSHKDIALDSDEIKIAFESGMVVDQVAIEYKDSFTATYNTNRQLKSFKLSDDLKDKAQDGAETMPEVWQATRIILADVLSEFYLV